MTNTIVLHSLSSYTFGTENPSEEEQSQPAQAKLDKITRLRQRYETDGTTRRVKIFVLAHDKCHPNIFVLQKTGAGNIPIIPGGKLKPGEDDHSGIERILSKKLEPLGASPEIGELIATWYRPQFADHWYPYLPVHISTPKEIERWYVVLFPAGVRVRTVPPYKIMSLPLYDMNANQERVGFQLSTIPSLLSRFEFTFAE